MQNIIDFIKKTFNSEQFVALHEPKFFGNEKKYVNECLDSTFVSSVGKYVDHFENEFAKYVGAKYTIATVNGTAALHIALKLADVNQNDEVITQPITFIATANAIVYCGANPIFVDVDADTMGMSPDSLETFLNENCSLKNNRCVNRTTMKIVKACVPMHTFGHPCRIEAINEICERWNIALVEDAAESLGNYYKGQHTGTLGLISAFSFNGNKVITSGGGGAIVTQDATLAKRAKHLTTTAKIPHPYEYMHDEIGFNYRLPNLNAALLCAQLEQCDAFLKNKRELAHKYEVFFAIFKDISFFKEPQDCISNYWLKTVILDSKSHREQFLKDTNANGVMTRPIWKLMNELAMFKNCQTSCLKNANFLEESVVNIPSSVRV